MDDRLDAINRRLGEIIERINALPADAFPERFELQRERDRLRSEADAYRIDWDAERSTGDLLAELGGLRARLSGIERQRIDLVTQSGGMTAAGPGADGMGGVVLNQGIESAQGAGDLKARIGRIKGILLDRGVDPEEVDR